MSYFIALSTITDLVNTANVSYEDVVQNNSSVNHLVGNTLSYVSISLSWYWKDTGEKQTASYRKI